MAEVIKVHAAAVNGVCTLLDANKLVEMNLTVKNLTIRGQGWFIPQIYDERCVAYNPVLGDIVKPQVDAVKFIQVTDQESHQEIYFAIEDSATLADFVDKCNGCCGPAPEMTAPTIPVPIVEQQPCPTVAPGTQTYTFRFPFPANPNSLNFLLQASFNDAYASPAPDPAGHASAAATLTWVQANWGGKGTWSLDGTAALVLVSTTTITANVSIGLLKKDYCLPIPSTAAMVDRIVIDGVEITFEPTLLSRTTPEAVFYKIRPYLDGTLNIVSTGSPAFNKYQYSGVQLPGALKNGATTVASFGAGAC